MKTLLFTLTLGVLAVAGCATNQDKLEDPRLNHNDRGYNLNSHNPGTNYNYNSSSVTPDYTNSPNPSALNPTDPQSDNALLHK